MLWKKLALEVFGNDDDLWEDLPVEQINENVPVFASKFNYDKSNIDGLKSYCKGSVKEGVGAGGVAVYSIANDLNPEKIREFIENKFNEWYKQ